MAAAARDRREKPQRGRAGPPQPPLPQPDRPAAVPGPALGSRRRPAPPQPFHVHTIFEAPPEPPHRFGPAAAGAWCDLCCCFVLSQGLCCADCRYTCHAHCQDLVHLGCQRNGKLMDCLAPHDTLDSFYSSSQNYQAQAVPFYKLPAVKFVPTQNTSVSKKSPLPSAPR